MLFHRRDTHWQVVGYPPAEGPRRVRQREAREALLAPLPAARFFRRRRLRPLSQLALSWACVTAGWSVLGLAVCPSIATAQNPPRPSATPSVEADASTKASSETSAEATADASSETTAGSDPKVAEQDLTVDQARLSDRYKRLEQVVLRLAELTATSNPRRAALLRKMLKESKKRDVDSQFEVAVQALGNGRLALAVKEQTSLEGELDALLQLLLKEHSADRIESEKQRIARYLKQLNRIIRQQRGVKARTEGGDDAERLARDQGDVTGQTGKLGDAIEQDEKALAGDLSGDPTQDAEPTEETPSDQDDQKRSESDRETDPDGSNAERQKDGSKESNGEPSDGSDQPSEDGRKDKPSESSPSSDSSKPSNGEGKPSEGSKPPQGGEPSEGGRGSPSTPPPGESNRGESNPPNQREASAQQQIRAAQQRMEQAEQALKKAERDGAAQEQQAALEQLEQARAELETILRQLREEEIQQVLTMLETRFRRMLAKQLEIYDGTVKLDKIPQDDRDHDDEIEAGRLSRREAQLVLDADKALVLLREEGSSVAFPETVEQMRDDMQQVADRLARLDVDHLTQSIEQDIIQALEETIEALHKALGDLESQQGKPAPASQEGSPAESPLVDGLAELKMIRSLQLRVNRRTETYRTLFQEQPRAADRLLSEVQNLATRQKRIHQAARDLHHGRNRATP